MPSPCNRILSLNDLRLFSNGLLVDLKECLHLVTRGLIARTRLEVSSEAAGLCCSPYHQFRIAREELESYVPRSSLARVTGRLKITSSCIPEKAASERYSDRRQGLFQANRVLLPGPAMEMWYCPGIGLELPDAPVQRAQHVGHRWAVLK